MFYFRLALALGTPVKELLATHTAAELAEYKAFDNLEPIGERRADMRTGSLLSGIYNMVRSEKAEPLSPWDFMLFLSDDEILELKQIKLEAKRKKARALSRDLREALRQQGKL